MQKKLSFPKIKSWIIKHKILDVIIFGSCVRGKSKPNDIDLCILIKDEDEKKSLDLIDSLYQITEKLEFNFHINILTASSFISGNTLVKTLLNEGFSIKKSKKLSTILGFNNKSLFVYSLKNFSSSKRVQFHYTLKGRYGTEGMLKEVQGEFLGTGTIIVPTEKEDLLKEVFDKWGIKYKIDRILIS